MSLMLQNLQNIAKFQNFQLDNLVDFEKCCQTHIYLQNFVLIQPKTSQILPKFCQKLATTRQRGCRGRAAPRAEPSRIIVRRGLKGAVLGCRHVSKNVFFGTIFSSDFRNIIFVNFCNTYQSLFLYNIYQYIFGF